MQKAPTFVMAMMVISGTAIAGIVGIGATTLTAAYGQISQPPITSNDECLSGSVVHCIDDEENPPNSNENCLPGSVVHCIDDHNNLVADDLFELDVDDLDDLFDRLGLNH